jgi:hypothetical protein
MPLILGPVIDYYEVIGEAYVRGIVHEQAISALEWGMVELQEFKLR